MSCMDGCKRSPIQGLDRLGLIQRYPTLKVTTDNYNDMETFLSYFTPYQRLLFYVTLRITRVSTSYPQQSYKLSNTGN